MSTVQLDTNPHLLVKRADELDSFGVSLRQIEDLVFWCDCWPGEIAKEMVYPETARIPLRGRQQVRQSLRGEILVAESLQKSCH